VAAILMVCFGILSQQEARDAVNWEIYTTIACAFGIGTALTNSGVAGGVAIFLVRIGEAIGIGSAGLFGSVYFATFLISNVVTNNAAAALIFPIGMDAAEQTGTDITLMSYCIMLGASASFMSPFGYTTNIMVYGPGGYKYKDFLKIGTPMQLILWLLTVASLSQGGSNVPWYLSWIITTLVLVVVALGKMLNKEGNLLNSAIVALQQMLKRGTTLLDFVVVAIRNTLNRGGNLVNRWKESPREERNDN
jgi:Na+/H+ antiporter NhaD/arsenite permease-like protein